MRWVQSVPADFEGTPPSPRSGHSAVKIGSSYVLIFGGLVDKKFLSDLTVFDAKNKNWFEPGCTGSGSDDQSVGPCPRAFHVAVAIDCHMFIFGGRSGRNRLGDFWMLDTDIWQWAELTGFGDVPSARDFSAGASIGDGKIVLYGGWDGSKWLSDVYILDTITLEWRQLQVTGPSPPPRCGHTATLVEKRLLIFGGRGGGGPIMGDLWALKGLFDDEKDLPAWVQLKLPGQAPAPRCGHSVTAGGHQLLFYGGHGTGGWLTRYDIYHSDCVILDRASVQWKKLAVTSDLPPPRAYHTMTRVGNQFLLVGGYDGKSTFGDFWWLVSEDDPMAKRALQSAQKLPEVAPTLMKSSVTTLASRDTLAVEEGLQSPLVDFRRRLGLSPVSIMPEVSDFRAVDEQVEKQLFALGLSFSGQDTSTDRKVIVKVRFIHLPKSSLMVDAFLLCFLVHMLCTVV
ncbi:hypothetical protein KP509_31G070600 [Ceratopteris richardii]|uniref:Uncharacterized protein n=1 Tax=Ceratopteris richardii TaxID=49495 RepID=A0A8T2QYW9_CERRI|nr:hypothetical protein KP509_31G070600 [Ceratopteris richardii]